jgi:GTPase SAR1 family protein/rubredoxin
MVLLQELSTGEVLPTLDPCPTLVDCCPPILPLSFPVSWARVAANSALPEGQRLSFAELQEEEYFHQLEESWQIENNAFYQASVHPAPIPVVDPKPTQAPKPKKAPSILKVVPSKPTPAQPKTKRVTKRKPVTKVQTTHVVITTPKKEVPSTPKKDAPSKPAASKPNRRQRKRNLKKVSKYQLKPKNPTLSAPDSEGWVKVLRGGTQTASPVHPLLAAISPLDTQLPESKPENSPPTTNPFQPLPGVKTKVKKLPKKDDFDWSTINQYITYHTWGTESDGASWEPTPAPRKHLLPPGKRFPGNSAVQHMRLQALDRHLRAYQEQAPNVAYEAERILLEARQADWATPKSGDLLGTLTSPVVNAIRDAYGIDDMAIAGAAASSFISLIAGCTSLFSSDKAIGKFAAITTIISSLVGFVCALVMSSKITTYVRDTLKDIHTKLANIIHKALESLGISEKKEPDPVPLEGTIDIPGEEDPLPEEPDSPTHIVTREAWKEICLHPKADNLFDVLSSAAICTLMEGTVPISILGSISSIQRGIRRDYVPWSTQVLTAEEIQDQIRMFCTLRPQVEVTIILPDDRIVENFNQEGTTVLNVKAFLSRDTDRVYFEGTEQDDDALVYPLSHNDKITLHMYPDLELTPTPVTPRELGTLGAGISTEDLDKPLEEASLDVVPSYEGCTEELEFIPELFMEYSDEIPFDQIVEGVQKVCSEHDTSYIIYVSDVENNLRTVFTGPTDRPVMYHFLLQTEMYQGSEICYWMVFHPTPPIREVVKAPFAINIDLDEAHKYLNSITKKRNKNIPSLELLDFLFEEPIPSEDLEEEAPQLQELDISWDDESNQELLGVHTSEEANSVIDEIVEEVETITATPNVKDKPASHIHHLLSDDESDDDGVNVTIGHVTTPEEIVPVLMHAMEVNNLGLSDLDSTTANVIQSHPLTTRGLEDHFSSPVDTVRTRTITMPVMEYFGPPSSSLGTTRLPTPNPPVKVPKVPTGPPKVSTHMCSSHCRVRSRTQIIAQVVTLKELMGYLVEYSEDDEFPDLALNDDILATLHITTASSLTNPICRHSLYRVKNASELPEYYVLEKFVARERAPGVIPPYWGGQTFNNWSGSFTGLTYTKDTIYRTAPYSNVSTFFYMGKTPKQLQAASFKLAKKLGYTRKHIVSDFRPEIGVYMTSYVPDTIPGILSIQDYVNPRVDLANPRSADDSSSPDFSPSANPQDFMKLLLGGIASIGVIASLAEAPKFKLYDLTRNISSAGGAVRTMSEACAWVSGVVSRSTDTEHLEAFFLKLKKVLDIVMSIPVSDIRASTHAMLTIRKLQTDLTEFRMLAGAQPRNANIDYYMKTCVLWETQLSNKFRDVLASSTSMSTRPHPVMVQIAGPSGIGKSYSLKPQGAIALEAKKMLNLDPGLPLHIMEIDNNGYFNAYDGHPISVIEEMFKNGDADPIIQNVHKMVNSAPYNLPGAFVKDVPMAQRLIFCPTNITSLQINTLATESVEPFWSRFLRFRVSSPTIESAIKTAGSKNVDVDRHPRNWIWERISRKSTTVGGNATNLIDNFEPISYEAAMLDIHRELVRHDQDATADFNIYNQIVNLAGEEEFPYAVKVANLPPGFKNRRYAQPALDNFKVRADAATPKAGHEHMVIHLTGPPGVGKTTLINNLTKKWKELDQRTVVKDVTDLHQFVLNKEYLHAHLGDVFVINDLVLANQAAYHAFYESFVVPVVIVITSNMKYTWNRDVWDSIKKMSVFSLQYPAVTVTLPEIESPGLGRRLGFNYCVKVKDSKITGPNSISQFHRHLPTIGTMEDTCGYNNRSSDLLQSEVVSAFCKWRSSVVTETQVVQVQYIDTRRQYDITIKAASLAELRHMLRSDASAIRSIGTSNKPITIAHTALTKLAENGVSAKTWVPPTSGTTEDYVKRMYALAKRSCPELTVLAQVGSETYASYVPGVIETTAQRPSILTGTAVRGDLVDLTFATAGNPVCITLHMDTVVEGCLFGWARTNLDANAQPFVSTLMDTTATIAQIAEVEKHMAIKRKKVENLSRASLFTRVKNACETAINQFPTLTILVGLVAVYFAISTIFATIGVFKDVYRWFKPKFCPNCYEQIYRTAGRYECKQCRTLCVTGTVDFASAEMKPYLKQKYNITLEQPLDKQPSAFERSPTNEDPPAPMAKWALNRTGAYESKVKTPKTRKTRKTIFDGKRTAHFSQDDTGGTGWAGVAEDDWGFGFSGANNPSQLESLVNLCKRNRVTVRTSSSFCYGLAVDSKHVYTVSHLWFGRDDIVNEEVWIEFESDGKLISVEAKLKYLDFSREVACLELRTNRSFFKNITAHLTTPGVLLEATCGAITKYNEGNMVIQTGGLAPSKAFGLPDVQYKSRQRVTDYVELRGMDLVANGFNIDGQCGSPVFAKVDGTWHIMGLFALVKVDRKRGGCNIIDKNMYQLCADRAVPLDANTVPNTITIGDYTSHILPGTKSLLESVSSDPPRVRVPPCAQLMGSSRPSHKNSPRIVESPLHADACKILGPPPCIPVTMEYAAGATAERNNAGRMCPYTTELAKMTPGVSYNEKIAEVAWDLTQDRLHEAYGTYKKISEFQVLNGDGEGLNKLKLNSSSGPVMQHCFKRCNKRDYFKLNENDDIRFNNPTVRSWYDQACELIEGGNPLTFVISGEIKEELLPAEKVLAGKKRLYWVSDMVGILLERKYFGGFLSKISSCAGPVCIGFDTRYEWSEYEPLFRKYPHHIDADRSKFDKNLAGIDMQRGIQCILSLCEDATEEEEEALAKTFSHYIARVGDAVAFFKDGMPSGLFITNMLDSTCSLFQAHYALLSALHEKYPDDPPLVLLNKARTFYVLANGDDISILSSGIIPLDVEVIIGYMNHSGIETTPPQKDGTDVKDWQHWPKDPIDFISRAVGLKYGRIFAPLKLQSVFKSLYYLRSTARGTMMSNFDATLQELYLHQDRELYEKVYNMMIEGLDIPTHIYPFRSWKEAERHCAVQMGILVYPNEDCTSDKQSIIRAYLKELSAQNIPDYLVVEDSEQIAEVEPLPNRLTNISTRFCSNIPEAAFPKMNTFQLEEPTYKQMMEVLPELTKTLSGATTQTHRPQIGLGCITTHSCKVCGYLHDSNQPGCPNCGGYPWYAIPSIDVCGPSEAPFRNPSYSVPVPDAPQCEDCGEYYLIGDHICKEQTCISCGMKYLKTHKCPIRLTPAETTKRERFWMKVRARLEAEEASPKAGNNMFQETATSPEPFAFDGCLSPAEMAVGGVMKDFDALRGETFALEPIVVASSTAAGTTLFDVSLSDLMTAHPHAREFLTLHTRVSGGCTLYLDTQSSTNIMSQLIAYFVYPVNGVIPTTLTYEQKQLYRHKISPISGTSAVVSLQLTSKSDRWFETSELLAGTAEVQPRFRIDAVIPMASVFDNPGETSAFINVSLDAAGWVWSQVVLKSNGVTSLQPQNLVDVRAIFTKSSAIIRDGVYSVHNGCFREPLVSAGQDVFAWNALDADGYLEISKPHGTLQNNLGVTLVSAEDPHDVQALGKAEWTSHDALWDDAAALPTGTHKKIAGYWGDPSYSVIVNAGDRAQSWGFEWKTGEHPNVDVACATKDGNNLYTRSLNNDVFISTVEIVADLPVATVSYNWLSPMTPGMVRMCFREGRPFAHGPDAGDAGVNIGDALQRRFVAFLKEVFQLATDYRYYAVEFRSGQGSTPGLSLKIMTAPDDYDWEFIGNQEDSPFLFAVMYGGYPKMTPPLEVRADYIPPASKGFWSSLMVTNSSRRLPIPNHITSVVKRRTRRTTRRPPHIDFADPKAGMLSGIGSDIGGMINFKRQGRLMDKQAQINKDTGARNFGYATDLANQSFQNTSKLSSQSFTQNSQLSAQNYRQQTGLANTNGRWNLANTNTRGNWDSRIADSNNQNRLQLQKNQQNFQASMAGARQQGQGATMGGLNSGEPTQQDLPKGHNGTSNFTAPPTNNSDPGFSGAEPSTAAPQLNVASNSSAKPSKGGLNLPKISPAEEEAAEVVL